MVYFYLDAGVVTSYGDLRGCSRYRCNLCVKIGQDEVDVVEGFKSRIQFEGLFSADRLVESKGCLCLRSQIYSGDFEIRMKHAGISAYQYH